METAGSQGVGKARAIACLWPGLPQLWFEGSLAGLTLALGFSLLLNASLIASFVWTELLSSLQLGAAWTLAGLLWAAAATYSWRRAVRPRSATADALFVRGQEEYLQGKWLEAETTWKDLLRSEPKDADARLALATLYRHTGRFRDALRELDRLERLEGAAKWRREIQQERQGMAELAQPEQTPAAPPAAAAEVGDSRPAAA